MRSTCCYETSGTNDPALQWRISKKLTPLHHCESLNTLILEISVIFFSFSLDSQHWTFLAQYHPCFNTATEQLLQTWYKLNPSELSHRSFESCTHVILHFLKCHQNFLEKCCVYVCSCTLVTGSLCFRTPRHYPAQQQQKFLEWWRAQI